MRIHRALKKNRGRSASTFGEQMLLVTAVLNIPKEVPGVVAEFGCYKGLSSVALSIAAKYVGRKLLVFDSFEGLPDSAVPVTHIADEQKLVYKKGDFTGTLNEVRAVVQEFGEPTVVEFIKGFFSDTLPTRPKDERYAMIFEDADLVESVKDILQHAWPRLEGGCYFFCHEALDLEVVKLFYADPLWKEVHGMVAPGLAGAGLGLPIDEGQWGSLAIPGLRGSCLGYVQKRRADAGARS